MSATNHPQLVLKLPAWRSRLLLLLLLAWFVALAARALYLQGLNHDFLQQKGESRYSRVIDLNPTRGKIVDRNNQLLAISTPVESVAASPADVDITQEQVRRLNALDVLDDVTQPVLDDAAAARPAGEVLVEGEFERFLALAVDVGDADQVRRYFARRVVAAVLALQEHPRDTEGDDARGVLRRQLPLEVDELALRVRQLPA